MQRDSGSRPQRAISHTATDRQTDEERPVLHFVWGRPFTDHHNTAAEPSKDKSRQTTLSHFSVASVGKSDTALSSRRDEG